MAAMQSRGGGSRGGGNRNRDDRGASRSHQSISLDHQHSGNWERGGHHPGGGRDDRRPPPRDDRRSGGDQWERGRNFHAMAQPPINLHKTDSQYTLKSYKTDDPLEEQKQRDFTSFLNKLTPDNFDRLILKICNMEITGPQTLKGFVDQIFQKALVETIFCELYAELCQTLFEKMPKFEAEENGQVRKYNVRTIILEKCQEEFEKGSRAALAQKKREAREAEAAAKAAEGSAGKSSAEATLTPEEDLERRRKEMEEAAAEVAARKRALGNMQFIGFLFKKSLLTETVLHTCIQELLQDKDNPKPEDLECVSKLLQTTGANLEVGKHPHLFKAYFARIEEIAKLKTLDSRIRFMLIDLIELRQRGWHARREAEGPKKIEEIHREAAQQEQQARRNAAQHRHEERRRGGPMDHHNMGRGGMGERPRYTEGPVQPRVLNMGVMNPAHFGPSGRMGGRGGARGGMMQRQPSAEVSLRPGGMPGRGMANGMAQAPVAPPPVPSGPSPSVSLPESPVSPPEDPSVPPPAALTDLDRDKLQMGIKNALGEYKSHGNLSELLLSLKELVTDRGAQPSSVLCFIWLALCNIHKAADEYLEKAQELTEAAMTDEKQKFATAADVVPAFERLITQEAADFFDENSKAKENLAHLVAEHIFAGAFTFKQFVEWVTAVDPEDEFAEVSLLVDGDHAAGFTAALINRIKERQGEEQAKQTWNESGATLSRLFPSYLSDDKKQSEAVKFGLSWVL